MGLGCIIGLVIVVAIIIGMLTLAVAAFRAFRLGPEATDLREAMREHFEARGHWHPMVELRLGPVLCSLSREILVQVADDPDATAALRAARALQVGVYQVSDDKDDRGPVSYLNDASATMRARGWSRAVAVVDGDTTVMVFVPGQFKVDDDVEFGVVVREEDHVVVAVLQVRAEPLWGLVQRHANFDRIREEIGREVKVEQ
jgi:hypothetical protein